MKNNKIKTKHKLAGLGLFVAAFFISYCGIETKIPPHLTQQFSTFLSVIFGFNITAIVMFYSSPLAKKLYNKIDDERNTRELYILRDYFKWISLFFIITIVSIQLFSIIQESDLRSLLQEYSLPFFNGTIDTSLIFTSIIFSLMFLDIYFLLILVTILLDAVIESAKE